MHWVRVGCLAPCLATAWETQTFKAGLVSFFPPEGVLLVLTRLCYALIIRTEYLKPHAKTNFYQQIQTKKELSRQHRSWLNWHFPLLMFYKVHALLMHAGNPFHSLFFNCMPCFVSNTHHPAQVDLHSTKLLAYSKQLLGFYSFTYNEAKRTNCFSSQVNQLKLRVI